MFESKINRGRANGYAPLDSGSKVPLSYLPPIQSTIDTGSLVIIGQTGSFATTSSLQTLTSSFNTFTSSVGELSASLNQRIINATNEQIIDGFATTASLQTIINKTGSFATTGSNQFNGNQTITGSLVVTSTLINDSIVELTGSDLIIEGGYLILTGSEVPVSLVGSIGDKEGTVVLDGNYLYYCTLDFIPETYQVVVSNGVSYDTHVTIAKNQPGIPNLSSNGWSITTPGDVTYILTGVYSDGNNWDCEIDNLNSNYNGGTQTMTLTDLNYESTDIWKKVPLSGIITGSQQILDLGFVTGSYTTINSFNSLTQSFNSISQSFNVISGSVGGVDFNGVISGSYQITEFGFATTSSILNVNTSSLATTGSNIFTGDQTITGSLAINDSATNFLIEGNGFSQTYLTSNGAIVLNPGYGGVEMVGSYRELRLTDIYAAGFLSASTITGLGNAQNFSASVDSRINTTTASFNNFTASVATTSSINTLTSSFTAFSSSVNTATASLNSKTGSYATTGSNVFSGSQSISGSLTVASAFTISASLTANSSSLTLNSGSNLYIQNNGYFELSGSSLISGSLIVIGNSNLATTTSINTLTSSFTSFTASVNTATSSLNTFSASVNTTTASLNSKTGSYATTGSNVFSGSQTITGSLTINSGSITMPNRPAFRVVGTGGAVAAQTVLSGSQVSVDFNQGNHFNTTTGLFTAPIAGLYQLNLVMRTNSNTNSTINQVIVYKSGSSTGGNVAQIMVEWAANTTANHMGGSTISQLAVGDTLKAIVAVGTCSFDLNDNFSAAYIG